MAHLQTILLPFLMAVRVVSPCGTKHDLRDVPLLIATQVEQTVAMTTKSWPKPACRMSVTAVLTSRRRTEVLEGKKRHFTKVSVISVSAAQNLKLNTS